jgi:hypothetical protein
MKERRTWKVGLSALLLLQVLVASSLAMFALVDFPGLLTQFGLKHQPDMGILQMIMTYNLILSMSICLWSVLWIRRGDIAGIQAGTTVGVLMFVVSTLIFVRFGRLDVLLFDGVRAFLKIVFGVLAYGEHKRHHATA